MPVLHEHHCDSMVNQPPIHEEDVSGCSPGFEISLDRVVGLTFKDLKNANYDRTANNGPQSEPTSPADQRETEAHQSPIGIPGAWAGGLCPQTPRDLSS